MIVTYHEVTPAPSRYVYSATTTQFEEHLTAVARLVSTSSEPLLTFDDGHASHYKHVLPALERFGLKGTFFVTAGWTDTRPEYMKGCQLRELIALGHSVESHGWSHALLTSCTPDALAMELRKSRLLLEDRLGIPVEAISMPGGRWNRMVLKNCAEVGYRYVFTSDLHAESRILCGLTVRGRAMVRSRFGSSELLALMQSKPKPWSASRLTLASKRAARAVVGDDIYQRIWAALGSSRDKAIINTTYKGRGA